MAQDNVIKEFLFVVKKQLIKSFSKVTRSIKRAMLPKQIITAEKYVEKRNREG